MASERRRSISLPFCPSLFSAKDESPRLRRKLQKAKNRTEFDPNIIGDPSLLSLGGGTHVGKSAVSTQNLPPLPPIPTTTGDSFLSIKYDPKLGISMINVSAQPESPVSTSSHGSSHSNHSASSFHSAASAVTPPSPTSSVGSATSPISPIIRASTYGSIGAVGALGTTINRSSNGHDIKAQVAAAAKMRAQEKAEKKAQAQNQVRALALIDAQEREAATQAWAAAHRTGDGLRSPLSSAGRPVIPPLTVPGTVQRHFPQFHRPYQTQNHQSAHMSQVSQASASQASQASPASPASPATGRDATAADHIHWHNTRRSRANSQFPPIVRHSINVPPAGSLGSPSQASLVPSSPGGTMSFSSTYASSFTHSYNGSSGVHGTAAAANAAAGSAPTTPLSPPHSASTTSIAPSRHSVSSSSDAFYAHSQLAKSSPRIVPELSHLVQSNRDVHDTSAQRSRGRPQSEYVAGHGVMRTRSKSCAPIPDAHEARAVDGTPGPGEKRRKPKTPVYSIGQLESTAALHGNGQDSSHDQAQIHASANNSAAAYNGQPTAAELTLLNSKSSIECIADEYRALLTSRNSAFTDALSDFGDERPSTVVHDPVRYETPLSYPPQQPQQPQQHIVRPVLETIPQHPVRAAPQKPQTTQSSSQNMRPLPLRSLQQQQPLQQLSRSPQPQKLHKQPRKFMLSSPKPKADSISSASPLPSPAFPSHNVVSSSNARGMAIDKQQPLQPQSQTLLQQAPPLRQQPPQPQPPQQFHSRNESRDTFGYARDAPLPSAPATSSRNKFEFEFDDDDNQHVQQYHLQQQQQQRERERCEQSNVREQTNLREQFNNSRPKMGHARNRSYVSSSSSGSSSPGGSASGSSINYSLPGKHLHHQHKYSSSVSSASTASSTPPPDNNVSLQICMDLLSRELTSAVTPAPGSKSTAERAAERKARDFWGDDHYSSKMPGSWLDSSNTTMDPLLDMPAPPPVTSASSALQVLVMIEAYEQLRDRMVSDARRAKRKDAGQVEQMFGLWLRTLYNMHDNLTSTGSETEAEVSSGAISESEYDSSVSIRS